MAKKLDPNYFMKSDNFGALLAELDQHSPATIGGVAISALKSVISAIKNVVKEPPITAGDIELIQLRLKEVPADNGLWDCVVRCCGTAFKELVTGTS